MDALSAGDHRNAVQRFREALLVHPDHVASMEQLAALQFSRGFVGEALQLLRDGLQRNPDASDLLLLKARIYERIDEPRAALDLLRGHAFRLPQDADLLILQGATATELEEFSLAIRTYRQLVSWRSDQGNWWLALGYALERSGDPLNTQEAAEAYRRALQDRTLSESARTFALNRREALGY
nr:tetratricopeptide repeat protein [Aliidiomarina indica]